MDKRYIPEYSWNNVVGCRHIRIKKGQDLYRTFKDIIFIYGILPLKMILVEVTFVLKKGDISRHKEFVGWWVITFISLLG